MKKCAILIALILASLVLFSTEVLSANRRGWIIGRITDTVTDIPLSGVRVEVQAHIMEKLADGTLRLRSFGEINSPEIILFTDDRGEFSAELFLNSNSHFFRIIAQLEGYEEAQDTLVKVESNKMSTIDLPLIPLNLTPKQLEILDLKFEQEKQRIYQESLAYLQELTEWAGISSSLPPRKERSLVEGSQQIGFPVPDEIYVCNLKVNINDEFTGLMNFDDFISGVVSAEMGGSFPIDALKAQAVASRSYALEKYNRTGCANGGQAYKSQVGKTSRDATMATQKIVILYSGDVIPAYFSARCNGDATLNSEDGVWNKQATCDVGGDYRPYARSQSCSGHKNCSSTNEKPCCHVFTGGRWVYIYGHGVGMCQRGAQDFANQGKDWQWILQHFYTNVELANLSLQPNLRPYKPLDWSDKIVVCNVKNTYTDSSPLYTTDTLYVDWAVINDGPVATPQGFSVALYIDGVLKKTWSLKACLNPNGYWLIKDYSIGKLSQGNHTLKIVADSTGAIQETDEGDNEYTKTITVQVPCTFTVTARINPAGSGTVTKNPDKAKYCSGEVVTLTAIPNAGYSFKGWSGVDSTNGPTATVTMSSKRTVTANFVKASKTVSSVTVTPSSWNFTSSGTKQLTATAKYSDNSTEDVTTKATWTSSNSNVATVNNSGLVTSGQNGSANIGATYGGKGGTCQVTVNIVAQTGILSVTTTPVSGAIYVDDSYKGTGSWSGTLNVGSHKVSFGDVPGYTTPSPQTITVTAGQITSVTGTYILIQIQRPNLTPYQPYGWSDKIVVSNVAGTTADSTPLYTTDTLYVDWAVINDGNADISTVFTTQLYVDGVLNTSWQHTNLPMPVGSYQFIRDYSIGSVSAGTHTLKIVTDSANVIGESNEGDNEYTKTIAVSFKAALHDDFSSDSQLWDYVGAAYRDTSNAYVVLTENTNWQYGIIWLKKEVTPPFTAKFKYWAGSGTGGDGIVMMFCKNSNYNYGYGGALGFNPYETGTAQGYGIEFDSYQNTFDPSQRHIALIKDSVVNHLIYVNDDRTGDNNWHDVTVQVGTSSVNVFLDGSQVFSWTGTIDTSYKRFGFSASTGLYNNLQIIDDVELDFH